jgi:hypothetical protein
MNQGGYFGAYRGGFQTLPDNAYNMMTAPTRQNAETIGKVASGIGSIAQQYMGQKAQDKAFQQGAAAQYKGLESLSQATGTPVNPELANQYLNIGNMSPQQQAVFNQSLGQEAQNLMARYNISQAQARAAQAQGQMQRGVYSQGLNQAVGSFDEPLLPLNGQVDLPGNNLLPSIQNQPSVPVYGGAYDNFGSMMPRVGTVRRTNTGF